MSKKFLPYNVRICKIYFNVTYVMIKHNEFNVWKMKNFFKSYPGKEISKKPFQKIAGISDWIKIFLRNTCRELQNTWIIIWTFHKACIKLLNELNISSKKLEVLIFFQNLCKNFQNTWKIIFFLKVFCWFFYLGIIMHFLVQTQH